MEVSMRPHRTPALVFAAVPLAATAASPSPAAAFFFPIPLMLGPPRAVTVNPHRGPTESMGRGYKAWTGTRSRDEEDSKPRTRSRDDDSKPSKASTRTSSKADDGKGSSKAGKGAKSATKEANAKQRRSVDHEAAAASKGSGTSVQRASDTEGASLTATKSNTGDFDENLGEARIDDLVEQPPK